MKLVFRVDASRDMGSGHLMRCLTLAHELRNQGAHCQFICREHPGNLIALVRAQGFEVMALPAMAAQAEAASINASDATGSAGPGRAQYASWLGAPKTTDAQQSAGLVAAIAPDWLVVDHYAIDAEWEDLVRSHARHCMVIDDLADRAHACDLLLDQNLHDDMASRYDGLVPEGAGLLLGPDHVLLRPEFIQARQSLRHRDGQIKRILVFFGGSDITNQTQNVLAAWRRLGRHDITLDVVMGAASPNREEVQAMLESMPNVALHCQVSNMAALIARADLGIGAGGSAMWERCYLGLPTLTVTFADNQVSTTQAAASLGAIRYLGRCNDFVARQYADAIAAALANPQDLQRMSAISLALISPGARQVADLMQRYLQCGDVAAPADEEHNGPWTKD